MEEGTQSLAPQGDNTMVRTLLLMMLIGMVFVSRDSPPKYKPATRTGTRFVESRGQFDGDIWLSWGSGARVQFVRGFRTGYRNGGREACAQSWTGNRERLNLCKQAADRFRRGSEGYEEFVTNFYLSYADDRDIPMQTLIEFAGEESAEQVHEWADTLDKPRSLFH
jgi:hypothetical protein